MPRVLNHNVTPRIDRESIVRLIILSFGRKTNPLADQASELSRELRVSDQVPRYRSEYNGIVGDDARWPVTR